MNSETRGFLVAEGVTFRTQKGGKKMKKILRKKWTNGFSLSMTNGIFFRHFTGSSDAKRRRHKQFRERKEVPKAASSQEDIFSGAH